MRFFFLVMFLFLSATWFFLLPSMMGKNQVTQASGAKPYERYKDNTVAKPTWDEASDQMVLVETDGNIRPYYIDKYEAVISQQRAWSVPGEMPTTKLNFNDAKEACAAAGKRICTQTEWQVACRDGNIQPVYFQHTKQMLQNCDFGRSKGYDNNDHAGKTDSHPKCMAPKLKLHHMFGNIAEMTQASHGGAAVMGMTYLGTKYYGAAFEGNPDKAMRMACEYTVMNDYGTNRYNEGIGFRCCRDVQ